MKWHTYLNPLIPYLAINPCNFFLTNFDQVDNLTCRNNLKKNIQGQNCFFCKIWGYKTFLIRKIKIKTKKISKSLGIKVYIISKSFHALIFFNISDIQLTKWICNGKNVIYRVDVKIKIVNGCSQQKKKHKNV